MQLRRYLEDVVVWAPAKVNLHLEVLGKRPDGYHEIATLMVAIRLYDTLVFAAAEPGVVELTCNRPSLSTGPDNLVARAARLLQDRTGEASGCRIRLIKRIPLQAGLAGGSTDAAAALLGLNRLWGLDLTRDALAALGAELGSDVPFFFHTPAAWCTGRGERVEPMPVGGPLDLVLVCPAFGMPTAAVYRQVTVPEAPVPGEPIRAALAAGDAAAVGRLLHNRLQPAAEALDPRLAGYASRLAALGPAGRLMSGSGSTLFAVCGSPADARRVADALGPTAAAEGFSILTARTCA